MNFIYKNQKYPINSNLVNNSSSYFSEEESLEGNVNLVNIFDSLPDLPDETIYKFIQYSEHQEIEINNDNVFSIKYLSSKYNVESLHEKAENYIKFHYKDLIDQFLSSNDVKNQDSKFREQEKLFSLHISEYITDNRLSSLPISILYRLLGNYKNQINKNDETKIHNLIDFLIECIKKHGINSSILFDIIDIENENIEYLFDKLDDLGENINFDFNIIKSKIFHHFYNQYKKMKEKENKQQEMNNNISNYMKEMKIEMEKMKFEMEQMKTNYDKKIDELKKINQQQKNEMNEEIESKLETLFILLNDKNEPINNLCEILSFIIKKNLKIQNPIKIFDSFFIPNEARNLNKIVLLLNDHKEKIIGIHSNIIEMLFSDISFNFGLFLNLLKNYSKIFIEIRSSASNFDVIFDTICDYKKQLFNSNNKIYLKIIFDGNEIKKISNKKDMINFISIESSVTSIEDEIFENFSSLSKITIPSSVTKMGSSSFKGCSSLTNIDIPQSLETIGSKCFSGCSSLESILIPPKITTINELTFEKCSNLNCTEIPSSVSSIKSGAFQGCSSLTTINIPSSVNDIGSYSFSDCSSLKHIFIPSSVKLIGEKAFENCKSLKIALTKSTKVNKDLGINEQTNIINKSDESETLIELGLLLLKSENKDEAFKYLKLSADKGNKRAMLTCGLMILQNNEIKVKKEEAVKYMKMAAESGNETAIYAYGKMLFNGEGSTVDKAEAFKYLKISSIKRNSDAMYICANMLYSGDGIPANKEEAFKYF